MKYYYIHGWNATGQTSAKALSEVLNEQVDVLSWDFSKPFNENLEEMAKNIEVGWFDTVLTGSSMGGFYANALANKLLVPCALFNPVLDAKAVLKKFQKDASDILTDEIINSYERGKDEVLPRLVVVGINDDVLNPKETIEYWKGRCELITVEEGHQIKDFKPFKENLLDFNRITFY